MASTAAYASPAYPAPADVGVVALGAFSPAFTGRLRAAGIVTVTDEGAARHAAGAGGAVLLLEAGVDPALVSALAPVARRRIVVARAETAAAALDMLDAGADDLIGEEVDRAELEDAINPRALREAFHGPRLVDIHAKMAGIAHEIEALLGPEAVARIERAPAAFAPLPPPATPAMAPQPATAQQVRALIRARRARAQHFPVDLFADPAWDILLDLMAARLEKKQVSVSSLCIAAAVPPTTALRWIKSMTDAALLERKPDPIDGRRVFIDLSDRALEAMQAYMQTLPRGLPV